MDKKFIYLDNNATTKTDPRVVAAMLPFFTEDYANASSSHLFGNSVREAVSDSRQQTADLIGAQPKEIIFTSGATEAINLAVKGLAFTEKKHIITISTEHKAVLDTFQFIESQQFEVSVLPVNSDGSLDLKMLSDAIRTDTLLISVMFANNETGVIHPIREIAEICHAKNVLFLCDATQAIGKLPVNVRDLGIDMMSFSAHKFYGPKGIGALYVASEIQSKLKAQQHGGGHERKLRSGTLNVPGIIGFGKACEIASAEMQNDEISIRKLRNLLEGELLRIENTFVNGDRLNRNYNTTNICFRGINSEELITALQYIAVSNGSACSAISTEPSHVLKAMGLSDADALASIRFSLGKFTTEEEIHITIHKVKELVYRLRT